MLLRLCQPGQYLQPPPPPAALWEAGEMSDKALSGTRGAVLRNDSPEQEDTSSRRRIRPAEVLYLYLVKGRRNRSPPVSCISAAVYPPNELPKLRPPPQAAGRPLTSDLSRAEETRPHRPAAANPAANPASLLLICIFLKLHLEPTAAAGDAGT